jgi:hypothetical protein
MAVETTMNGLLADLKRIVLAETASGGDLYGIRQVKRGILPVQNQFPIITLLPAFERVKTRYSGRYCEMLRGVDVYIFADPRKQSDIYTTQSLADKTMEVIRENRTVANESAEETTLDAEFGSIGLDGPRRGAHFEVIFSCEETLPARTLSTTITNNPVPGTLNEAIYDVLNGLKSSTLSSVREVFREHWAEVHRLLLPAITVETVDQENRPEVMAMETLISLFDINLFSRVAGASDQTLVNHLTIIEPLKDALMTQPNWGGIAEDTEIVNISFGQELANNDLLYNTTVRLSVTGRHLV